MLLLAKAYEGAEREQHFQSQHRTLLEVRKARKEHFK
jgi:hypothetical protein